MTTQQLYLFNAMYAVVFAAVAVLTRATAMRIAGALAGGIVIGPVGLGIVALGERLGWWHMPMTWTPYYLTLMWIDFAVGGFVFLLTWRIARRFGWRGLTVVVVIAACLGPVRDYAYMRQFPEWGAYAPGWTPALAVSAAYVLLGTLGHATMRLVAGPARADRLARRPWERA
ncbi:MAG TPA: hypothetical protein VGH33_03665 [Isosphaeraceae bacterium]|jgi:hypothetical protein